MLSPLRGLAETFITVPQVLEELKDKRAREHFEKLGLIAGVNVKVQSPDPASLAHGTRSVFLSHPSRWDLMHKHSDTIRKKDGRLLRTVARRSVHPSFDLCAG